MSELARLHATDAPASFHPLWLPSQLELASRPHERAYAIDPKNPLEIDDAIKTEHRSATEHRIAVFISDIGLIEHETEALTLARKRGWSRYAHSKHDRDITMFDRSIYEPLGLDQRHYDIGAPAIKIGFSVNPQTGSWGEVDFSRVAVEAYTYTYEAFDREITRTEGVFNRLQDTGGAIARVLRTESLRGEKSLEVEGNTGHAVTLSSTESVGKELVARYMVIANFIVAAEMDRRGVPWLYRNHGLRAIDQMRQISEEDRQLFNHFMKAVYNSDRVEHLGLGLWAYCHITSGLRRFPDAANALNLIAIIEGRSKSVFEVDEMREIGNEMTAIYRKEMIRHGRRRAA